MAGNRAAPRAIIVGGSVAGLFCGLSLRRIGWDVTIHERVPVPLSGRGAGIVTHDALFEALAEVGIAVSDDIGVSTPGRVIFERDGSVTARLDLPQILTSWGRIYEILGEPFPEDCYLRGQNFVGYREDPDGVTARFADGSEMSADLLIGADGFRSSVREQMQPDSYPQYAGYIAWRGLVDESALSDRARREMFPYFAFCLPQGEQMLGYPVAGEGNDVRPGHRRFNFVWYRPADAEIVLPRLLTDADGRANAMSIAPNMIHPTVIGEMRDAAANFLSPQFSELVAKTAQPFIQPIYDLTVPRMVSERVVLIGDAAFVGRPHCGMGVTKAAQDAIVLGAWLSRSNMSIAEALAGFEGERRPVDNRVVARARELGAYMQAQILTDEERHFAERHRSPEAIMRETATSDFLQSAAT